MTLWGSDTVKDVAESVGVSHLNKDVTSALCRDVEYRLSVVLEHAMKFMRHSQRTILWSSDIAQALRVLDVEPLYGYESTRTLRYGEASLGPGQPLFYVEDEEMDFEKLINAPLPKVPREMSFTAHWLALEGVQPTIPQNPSTTDPSTTRALETLLPKTGTQTSNTLSAMADSSSSISTTKPLVKHILSKELQLYFEKVTTSVLDPTQPEYRSAGLASLREDPGLHQLVPYFVQYVAEKVTHNLRDLFILRQMMGVVDALSRNEMLNMGPYVASLVPPVLTCLTGRNLGPSEGTLNGAGNATTSTTGLESFELRDLAASLLKHLHTKFGGMAHNLKPRLARSCLKTWLDPRKSLGAHYGAILGIGGLGSEVVRSLVVPNLKDYDGVLQGPLNGTEGENKRAEAEMVMKAVTRVLQLLVDDDVSMMNGHANGVMNEDTRSKLTEKIGESLAQNISEAGASDLARAVLET